MSFWSKLFGVSKKDEDLVENLDRSEEEQGRKETQQIIEEPDHDLAPASPDDLLVVEENKSAVNSLDNKKEDPDNKDSP